MVGSGNVSMDAYNGTLQFEDRVTSKSHLRNNGKHFKKEELDSNQSSGESVEGIRNRERREIPRSSKGSVVRPEKSEESFLDVLLEGVSVPLDTEVPMNSKPPWLDENLLRKGREFARKYLFGVIFTQIPALAMVFAFQPSLEALTFTGKSDTPFKAFRRYLSTIVRLVSWYETDFFQKNTEGYKNMAAVRILHASIFKKMNQASEEELRTKASVVGKGNGVWSTYLEDLKKDFSEMQVDGSSCPFSRISSLSKEKGEFVYVSQLDLAYTQFTFLAMTILYPEYYGVHGATDEELEGFCHLWRCLGYHLGIKDRYNICSEEGLEATRERCRALMEKWVKPSFKDVTADWEHMYRCLMEGLNHYSPGNTFGGSMAHLMWVLGMPASNLRSRMSWEETIMFYLQRFILGFVLWLPGSTTICNYLLHLSLKMAGNVSPEWLQRKKNIIYDYEKSSSANI